MLNLKVLDLSANRISDFTLLEDLFSKLIEYDISNQTVSLYNSRDVNRDGIVNIIDLLLIASNFHNPEMAALAEMNIYPDVNGDGKVNVVDLILVAGELDSTAAAPNANENIAETRIFTVENLKEWIQIANSFNLQTPRFQKGIAFLEQLLASAEIPLIETALLDNYPNPFNPETWIPYQLQKSVRVTITIHSLDGKLIRKLEFGYQHTGNYYTKSRAAYWDGKNESGEIVANGVYFYSIIAGDFTATKKMSIRK